MPSEPVEARVEDLSHDGRGVARLDGKVTFIQGALPGERVRARVIARRREHDEAETLEVLEAAGDRVPPRCPHAALCGGCALQHLAPAAQLERKQATLLENLRRLGGVTPDAVLPPLAAGHWGYRRRARLSVRHVRRKERTLVGFRERAGRFVADLQECHVLTPAVGFRLAELGTLLDRLGARDRIPQIEVAAGDEVTVLVVRHMDPLSPADRAELARFEARTGLRIVLQPGGPRSLEPLTGEVPRLAYRPEPELRLAFTPTNFVQVNAPLNAAMVQRALDRLDLSPQHRALDLFCGLGNFSLPMARRAAHVAGFEGDDELVGLARDNAAANGIANVAFATADLREPRGFPPVDRVLLDPPRSGAEAVLEAVAETGAGRIVYVSCHPGSLARDAGLLVSRYGYRLREAGVMDMFPHTAHVESMAVFERRAGP